MTLDCAFPGGNIVVDSLWGDHVRLHQDLRDTPHKWFYWAFRLRGAQGRRLTFSFTQSLALGVRGPAFSTDGGETWQWLGADSMMNNAFTCAIPADAPEIRFSFGMPYQLDRWTRFAASLAGRPGFRAETLCVSNHGRPVPCAWVEHPGEPEHRVILTARHHCCEMMADYALEGLLDWLTADPEPAAAWLRSRVHFFVVPFADLDGVEAGDQGKGRAPRDHGRDYEGDSLYAETAAVRKAFLDWGQGKLHAAVDLHCPWISGARNETVYAVGSRIPERDAEQRRFSAALEAQRRGPIPVSASDYLPFGTDWNTAANYSGGKSFPGWAGEQPGVRLATGMELPYANAGGVEVNAATARLFGPDLGRALSVYLQTA